ncbi:MAG: methyltransferase domain-containing protein [Phycisphaerales bacterium]|nr:methyltransferase domain-containing protein [Phycisphaerales bacterium]
MSTAMERLSFDAGQKHTAIEAAIHLNRYLLARAHCAGHQVLDIACGQGYGAYLMAEQWDATVVHGVDISPEAIDSARRHFSSPRITYHCHAAEDLPALFSPGQFDLIVSLETFEHLRDPARVLVILKQLLRPEGVLILSCPNDHWYYRTPDEHNPFHTRKYTFDEFRRVAEDVLGPARSYLLGTPVAGYVNLAPDDRMLGRLNQPVRTLLEARSLGNALLVPTEEQVRWGTCSYFLGLWGPEDTAAGATATLFACSMDASEQAHRRAQVESLRDETVALRSELFDARRDLALSRERLREYESEVAEILRREQEVTEREQRYREAVGKAEYRIEQLEREVRHQGLRCAAVQAENEYIREQILERGRAAEAQATALHALQMHAADLEQQRNAASAEAEYRATIIAEWRTHIANLESELARARRLLLTSPYYLLRRAGGYILRRLRGRTLSGDSTTP